MQVNRVNNNTNNVNFRAKPVVKIGNKFFNALRALPPIDCATQANKATNIVRLFKRVAPGIAKEDDVLILRDNKSTLSGLEIALERNDHESVNEWVSFFSDDSSPMEQMQGALRSLSMIYGKNDSIDFEQVLLNPYADYLYREVDGVMQRVPFLDRPPISDKPQVFTVDDCLNMIRNLNTKA